jgi:hypothetical protein
MQHQIEHLSIQLILLITSSIKDKKNNFDGLWSYYSMCHV